VLFDALVQARPDPLERLCSPRERPAAAPAQLRGAARRAGHAAAAVAPEPAGAQRRAPQQDHLAGHVGPGQAQAGGCEERRLKGFLQLPALAHPGKLTFEPKHFQGYI